MRGCDAAGCGTPAIRNALLLGMSYIPAVMGIVSIFLLMGYKLEESDISD